MTVYLVGTGPGHPDLLTVRAMRLISEAEVVVHDRATERAILDLVPERALRIDVGTRPGRLLVQDSVHDVLIGLGRRHEVVVRLEAGDPLLLGRGAEELAALQAAGVAVAVVPGVSSAVAIPAASGIPVTHRGVAAAVTIVNGHRSDGGDPVDWGALAHVGGTLVVLMGTAQGQAIAGELLRGGLAATTPVAAIRRNGAAPSETRRFTLCELEHGGVSLAPPVTLVIGEVAAIDLHAVPSA